MNKTRIQVYTNSETKRRIELAAAKQGIAITQYCLEAIRGRLAREGLLEQDTIGIPVKLTREERPVTEAQEMREKREGYLDSKSTDVVRTQIELPRHVFELLQEYSRDHGISPTEQIVEMLTAHLETDTDPVFRADDPLLCAIPIAQSGLADLSANHDRYLYRTDWQEPPGKDKPQDAP